MNKETLADTTARVALWPYCNLFCNYCGGSSYRNDAFPAAMEDFRKAPMHEGNLSSDDLLTILRQLHEQGGMTKMRGTGGEPLLRHDWDKIITEISEMGYKEVDITTNGILLTTYLEKNGGLPKGLNVLKVSLDTCDPDSFREITGGGDLHKVLEGIRASSQLIYTRINRVLLRSEMTPSEMERFIDFCQGLGVKQVQYLDLVHYPNLDRSDKSFWEREFVAYPEFQTTVTQLYPKANFHTTRDQFGVAFHRALLPNGLVLSFKDSRYTMRDSECWDCPIFCQEGRCLVRVATDGNITLCPDYQGELPSFNARQALQDHSFQDRVQELQTIIERSEKVRTIELFTHKHNLELPAIHQYEN
ncbi:radical SAM protein [Candidatus Beckwithbacteria bacterium]|nr:radical SAM protein [Candidatus Beckwithbacteria bacterium]